MSLAIFNSLIVGEQYPLNVTWSMVTFNFLLISLSKDLKPSRALNVKSHKKHNAQVQKLIPIAQYLKQQVQRNYLLTYKREIKYTYHCIYTKR